MKNNHFKRYAMALLLHSAVLPSQSATLANRWSFDTDTTDSVGANTGILVDGDDGDGGVAAGSASVSSGSLILTGDGTGATANHMTFTTPLALGDNFGGTGMTIESWYTDTGTDTWGKLFHFGLDSAGTEIAYTHMRGGDDKSGVDRDGAKLLGEQVTQNEEHHLVITISPDGNMNAWVDGVKKISDSDTNDLSNVTSDFEAIGATSWGDPGMTGEVNEFRIWEGELTEVEVAASNTAGPDDIFVVDDADGDNLPDLWEDRWFGNLNQGPNDDPDNDGLTNLEELNFSINLDPTDDDTDDDGLTDGVEVNTENTDPFDDDSDDDTLTDGDEVNTHGTNPLLKDTDMDFYDDNVEIANGTNPNDANDPAVFTGTELTHRWSFTTGAQQLTDSVGGNTAVPFGDPEFAGNQIVLDGETTGPDGDSFGFTEVVALGANFGATGVSIESWYTDTGSGTWTKLFVLGDGKLTDHNLNFNIQRSDNEVSSIQYPNAGFSNETRPSLNEEHHLAITVTPSGELNAWIDGIHMNDGVPLGDGDDLNTMGSTFERIGASAWDGDASMAGSINEFRIWKGTLTASNVAENFAAGPDSLAGDSLRITTIEHDSNTGAVTLTFNSVSGRLYAIESSSELLTQDSLLWEDVDDGVTASSNSTTYIDNTASGAKLFYRVRDVTNN